MMRGLMPLVLLAALCAAVPGRAADDHRPHEPADREMPIPVAGGPGAMLTSNGTASVAARETAGPDTFVLYGGPDHPTEGKFQLANGVTADWGGGNGLPGRYGGGPDAWTPVDVTDHPVFWHRSQYNAQTLGTNQPSPNHAMWCGVEVGDPLTEDWVHVPGYGNSWFVSLLYESPPLADPSLGETVSLDFYFHHDIEPGYDYFEVEYDSAGTWTSVLMLDGSDKDTNNLFSAPGVQFSEIQQAPIYYDGNDFGGDNWDQIRIRLLLITDGAWSDQDGLWPTTAGAAQVDQITLTTSQGSFTEDYEAVLVPPARYLFHPDKTPFVGDFTDVYARLTDIDPCRDNNTPVVGFIDYGQIIRNGPGVNGMTSTGGSTSPGINYGIVGDYVVNHTDGLANPLSGSSGGFSSLYNQIWSPRIQWDLPGTADDDVDVSGAFIRFSVWTHLPFYDGIFYVWGVQSRVAGQTRSHWKDHSQSFYGLGSPRWQNDRHDVTDLMEAGPEWVQMMLAVIDLAGTFGFPGTVATPSPVFDNAAFYKYRVGGPTIATRTIDTAQDGFPINGSIDVSTQAARDALDVPFSMARDINSGDTFIVPGDSVIVDVTSVIPGATVTDIRMVWALNTNAAFEDALRTTPARAKDTNVVAGAAGTMWTGEVIADTARTSHGFRVRNRFFVDLPDVDFMYPGDVLHYYIQATDSDGRVSTLPHDTAGFLDFAPPTIYDRAFTVRCLPTITDTAGSQPDVLVWNDFGRRGGEAAWTSAFQQLGYAEGVDYDTYTTQGPTSGVSNGLGSAGAHGATAVQLDAYNHMFYFAGDLRSLLLSNGVESPINDKGDDFGLLEQWHALAGTRNMAYFGDYIATGLIEASPSTGMDYLGDPMGVAYGDEDVRDVIGNQTAPVVVPNAAGPYGAQFATELVAYGGCATFNEFDQIQPAAGASAGHLFTDASGFAIPPHADPASGGVASVINPRANGVDLTFPFSSMFVHDVSARVTGPSARSRLFAEILGLFSAGPGGVPVAAPGPQRAFLSVYPNPFNPVTVVKFTASAGSRGSVQVFNLRGELVRTLHSGEFAEQEFRWDGADSRGAGVSSGVYLIQATDGSTTQTTKVALVK